MPRRRRRRHIRQVRAGVVLTDAGTPGTGDKIGISLRNGNTLLFASEWNGSATVEALLDSGNLVVH